MTMTINVPKAPDSSFKTRLKSALILAPVVLVILGFGGGAFTIMMAAAAGIGAYEWTKMVTTHDKPQHAGLPWLAGVLTGLATLFAGMIHSPLLALLFLAALCFVVFAVNFANKGGSPWLIIFGMIYVGFACDIMVWLRNTTEHGLFNILTLLFIVWASDIFAYLTGRTFGGPKLAPSISPKKTWSGFIGSSVGAGAVAAIMAMPWMTAKLGVETLGNMNVAQYFLMGFVLAMFGQVGDLFISIYKRHYGIKDTGTIIPGHGGILDRIDALILVALIFGALAVVLLGV